jgi:single-strand DNA-binding protein
MQRLTIIGHCGQDAEVKDLGQNQVINFSVAVSESYISKQTNEKVTNTTWYEIAKWGNSTAIAQYLKKGTQVLVEGKPTARSWQKEDGTLVSVLGINAFEVKLLGGAKTETTPTASAPQQAEPSQANSSPIAYKEEEDDLPF